MFITTSLGVLHGFTFSAGALDYVLNFGIATKPIINTSNWIRNRSIVLCSICILN